MNPQRPLSDWVVPEAPARAALQLEWHEVRRRVKRHRQVRVAGAVVAALLLAGVVAGLALRPAQLREGERLAVVAPQKVRLADGSRLLLAEGAVTRLETASDAEVVVLLEQGRVTFDVSKRPTRRFVVKAEDVEVRVVGTQFTVDHAGAHVSVEVHEGIVEVREHGDVHRLVRGTSWASTPAVTEKPLEPSPAQPELTAPVEEATADAAPVEAPHVEPVKEPQLPPRPGKRPPARAERPSGGGGASGGGAALPPAPEQLQPTPPQPATPEPSAADAFANAMRARSAGHVKEAIVGFQQVCERFPSSAYAPMSAFEWGRLALDAQDDPRQAARAFERTLELATSSSLIEDALARLTEAYARYDVGSCRRVQAEYLRRFPGGPHVRGVTKACP